MGTAEQYGVRVAGGSCTLELHGRFDFNSYTLFRHATDEAMAKHGVREFVIDLTDVAYLDSSALGMLLNFNDTVQASGQSVVLKNPTGLVKQILDIANFQKIFEIR